MQSRRKIRSLTNRLHLREGESPYRVRHCTSVEGTPRGGDRLDFSSSSRSGKEVHRRTSAFRWGSFFFAVRQCRIPGVVHTGARFRQANICRTTLQETAPPLLVSLGTSLVSAGATAAAERGRSRRNPAYIILATPTYIAKSPVFHNQREPNTL